MNIDGNSIALGLGLGTLVGGLATALLHLPKLRRLERARTLAEAQVVQAEQMRNAQEQLFEKHLRIEDLVRPLHETIELYQREARELAAQRQHESGRVTETLQSLSMETQKLTQALRTPQARGRWGEITLRRTAELAGLSAHCDFSEQQTLDSTEGRVRPDMIVHLPGGREIAVDAKVPLSAFLDGMEASDEATRKQHLENHVRQLRRHIELLSSKGYQTYLNGSPEFVVLFLPNDHFLGAAAQTSPEIIEFSMAHKVALATPSTFFALLAAIAQGWKQEQLAENTLMISQLGQEMHDRLINFVDHLTHVGDSLDKAVEHYNSAIGSFSSRLLPSARKFENLGVGTEASLSAPRSIDKNTRTP